MGQGEELPKALLLLPSTAAQLLSTTQTQGTASLLFGQESNCPDCWFSFYCTIICFGCRQALPIHTEAARIEVL